MAANSWLGLEEGVALVTGAAGRGIGAAVARAFAAAGCRRVAITDLKESALSELASELREKNSDIRVVAAPGNIADGSFVSSLVGNVVHTFGRIDYAVNCAGVLGNGQNSTDTSPEQFDAINNVNYRGCWLCSREELKQMLKQDPPQSPSGQQRGAIVNIGSQLGIVGRSCAPAYSASKAAVIAMTRADAIDYSKDGIRVNCVCPGLIDTEMTTASPGNVELFKPAVKIAPMQRMGKPEEVANAVLFLCSPRASFVQGHAMVVDGGYVIN